MFLINSCQRYFRCGLNTQWKREDFFPVKKYYFAAISIHHCSSFFSQDFEQKSEFLLCIFVHLVHIIFFFLFLFFIDILHWILRQALFRSYGCFFAEFLGDLSLVRLSLLDLITCVGLRYGFYINKFRSFSRERALYNSPGRTQNFSLYSESSFKTGCGFSYTPSL